MTIPQGYSPKLRDHAVARKFVAQNSRGYLALGIFDNEGNPVDPEPGTLQLTVYFDDLTGSSVDPRGELIVTVDHNSIIRDDVGMYHYDVGPDWTKKIGLLNAEWRYGAADGSGQFQFNDAMQIQEQMPEYERLRPETKRIVEQVSWFFGDLFDSTAGGPWLQENYQTHFSYERIAQLSQQAVMKFNMTGFPVTSYGVTVDDRKLPSNLQQVIVWGTKLECIRHLALSYTEQPMLQNVQTNITDRRDYMDRWYRVLEEETPEYKQAVTMAKRSLLKLGRGSLLVSGGIYGGGMKGGFFIPGLYASQTRSFRFYPASFGVGIGNMAAGDAR
ncbi:hypothetical protein SEA_SCOOBYDOOBYDOO_113 [Mycobacterium phage ScoobyDoobyDoo]|nr:hypothetical protein SEA_SCOOBYDOOBYDOO_113 [Mycobacterium phage ScoobyDoobyDoo]